MTDTCKKDSFFDDFKKMFLDVYFEETEPVEKKDIKISHSLNLYGLPSAFSTEYDSTEKNTFKLDPIHRGTVLESKTVYDNWWTPFFMDGLVIDEMFELFNLQGYDNEYYNKNEECVKDAKSENCENYKKYKKYKMLSQVKGNPVYSKKYDENIKISKI
jgi:hypothetical protein